MPTRMFHSGGHKGESGIDYFSESQTDQEDRSASTPYDDDFYMADKLPDEEHSLILGLAEFEQSIRLLHEKKYTESEGYLKEALTILKKA